jgi:SAM-dependent methyltransferase
MEFTGERYVPGAAGFEELYVEHMSRYEFVRALAPGRRVLDVGSGCGYGTYHLATGGADLTVGIDLSPEAVEYSRRHYTHPKLFFAVMDAQRLDFKSRFDIVTCFELIEHVEGAEAVLSGVSRMMDQAGLFIVSTPNKATYVAGGEDGKNPFHVREYYREEFEDLLRRAFAQVRLLGQYWLEGMALTSHPALSEPGPVRAGYLPLDEATSPDAETGANPTGQSGAAEPPYFIALCANQDVIDDALRDLSPIAFYPRAVRYGALQEAARGLEGEFNRRGEWAQGLERECHAKDKAIESLRLEIAQLREEFDERGRWAQRLNGELRQSGALVERLAEENRGLREALSARRPAGGSRVKR